MSQTPQWYVFYTNSRAEKKTYETLTKFGFEAFLPLVTQVRQWSDRKKKVEVPLFNSYIFVHVEEHLIPEVVKVPGVAWNIRHIGKPAILRDDEKQRIERIISSGYGVEAINTNNFEQHDKVKVIDGALKGLHGVVLRNDPESILIDLQSISHSLKVRIEPFLLEKL